VKYAWIGTHIRAFALIEMFAVLDVSVSVRIPVIVTTHSG